MLKMKHSNYCNRILKYVGIQHTSKYNASKLFMCKMSRQGSNIGMMHLLGLRLLSMWC
jgi:hypothetical protein